MGIAMRAILIETDKTTIREIEFRGTLEHAYELLECELIESVDLGPDMIFVDEDGLHRNETIAKGYFKWRDYQQPLAGRGLITGYDSMKGDWIATDMTIEHATAFVTWLP
jgi:hypothetical protein